VETPPTLFLFGVEMQLTLYKTDSAPNVIGKVLTDPLSLTINLKATTNVIDPEILLSNRPGTDYLSYNYAHIDSLNRYYHIDSIESVNGSMFKLALRCDVLETYGDGILGSSCRYKRKVESGDYFVEGLNESDKSVITTYKSDVTIQDGVHTNVLTVVQGGDLEEG
jgi:hypothetical protein